MLQYSNARYYDPALERFISVDPVLYRAGMNLYEYVGDSPTNRIDPSGWKQLRPDDFTEVDNIPGGYDAQVLWGWDWAGERTSFQPQVMVAVFVPI